MLMHAKSPNNIVLCDFLALLFMFIADKMNRNNEKLACQSQDKFGKQNFLFKEIKLYY